MQPAIVTGLFCVQGSSIAVTAHLPDAGVAQLLRSIQLSGSWIHVIDGIMLPPPSLLNTNSLGELDGGLSPPDPWHCPVFSGLILLIAGATLRSLHSDRRLDREFDQRSDAPGKWTRRMLLESDVTAEHMHLNLVAEGTASFGHQS